jgi:hypothetical protein
VRTGDGAHRRGVVASAVAPNPTTVTFGAAVDNRPWGGLEGGGPSALVSTEAAQRRSSPCGTAERRTVS